MATQASGQDHGMSELDFKTLFENAPGLFLVLTPDLTIVAASNLYLQATMTSREFLLRKCIFEAFPDNPADTAATGSHNLRASLERVLKTRTADTMAVQKYDIRRPAEEGGGFEERFWSPVNSPVFGPRGELAYIVHRVEDVTQFVGLKQAEGKQQDLADELRRRIDQAEIDVFQRAQQLQAANEQLRQVNEALQAEIAERKQSEARTAELAEQLRLLNEELEGRVASRTAELAEANRELTREMAERSRIQERFRQAMESLPSATVVIDAAGRIVLVNEQTDKLFGYERAELLGQSVELLVPERLRSQHPAYRTAFFAQPETRLMGHGRELFGRHKNGSEFPVEIGLNPYRTSDEDFVLAMVVDISDRKRADEIRRQSEMRFRAIFNQTFELVGLLQTDGVIIEVNQPALDLRGLQHDDVVGRPLWETPWLDVSDEARVLARAAIAEAAAGQFIRQEMTVRNLQGELRTFDFSVKPVFNDAAQIELLIVEARDITDQKHLEAQFHQAQKMEAVGQLAGGIAHDFNNLLTIITGYSEMLLESLPAGEPACELIEEINRAGQRSAALTRQLLAFSRKQVLTVKVLDPSEVVRNTEKMLRRLIGEDVKLDTVLPEVDRVKVDPSQLEQILFNLAVNARDAMPQGGELVIETKNVVLDEQYALTHNGVRPGRYVLICITDSGEGMSSEIQRRIFEPFFTTKETGKGTGLGLAVVHGIVKQSDGHINVYSEVGVGTSFKIYLPAVERDVDTSGEASPRPATARGTETVLLVEDEEAVRMLGQRALNRYGYTVLVARSPLEAIQTSQNHAGPIDLLLTDVVMPEMNGRRLAEMLSPDRPNMKVLFMSGYTDDAIMRQGVLDAGVNFLHKPFTPADLAAKVRTALRPSVESRTTSDF
jgi:two-component system cell cycle sensor histidine kinase/response regulator CckA